MTRIRLIILLAVIGFAVAGACDAECSQDIDASSVGWADSSKSANAYQSEEEIFRHSQKVAGISLYRSATGRNPDIANLIQSLAIIDPHLTQIPEMIAALHYIAYSDEKAGELAPHVVACYEHNTYWLIRVKSVEALQRLDEKKADEYSHEMFADSKLGLEPKLTLARAILRRGKLFGYPFLEQGLAVDNKYVRDIAIDLLKAFEKYDGHAYDESGNRINLRRIRYLVQESHENKK